MADDASVRAPGDYLLYSLIPALRAGLSGGAPSARGAKPNHVPTIPLPIREIRVIRGYFQAGNAFDTPYRLPVIAYTLSSGLNHHRSMPSFSFVTFC